MMYVLIAITFFVCLFSIFLIWKLYNIVFNGHDPLYTTNKKLIVRMIEEFEIIGDYEGCKVYELGCGRAPFVSYFAKTHPKAKCIGVENNDFTCFLARMQAALHGGKIKIIQNDLFHVDIKDADLIYCYLDKRTIANVGRKIKFECKMGTRVISNKFPIPNMQIMKTIVLPEEKVKKGHEGENKIFYYEV